MAKKQMPSNTKKEMFLFFSSLAASSPPFSRLLALGEGARRRGDSSKMQKKRERCFEGSEEEGSVPLLLSLFISALRTKKKKVRE